MKIKIGPYRNWIGPYQLADLLQYIGVSEDTCDSIGKRLSKTWVDRVCKWVHDKKSRKIKIKIHPYDTWNMDHTLALIILPMLKQLKETKHGAPFVDMEDVPENLRTEKEIDPSGDVDEKHFDRWNYVLDEMIWAFGIIASDSDIEISFDKNQKSRSDRIDNGLRLFGKYYRGLWD